MRKAFYTLAHQRKRLILYNLARAFSILFFSCILFFPSSTSAQSSGLLQAQEAQARFVSEKTNPIGFTNIFNSQASQPFAVIEEIVVNNQDVPSNPFSPTAPLKVTLEQVRNGSATSPITGAWVGGNLNGSQAHFAEKWSIPYRLTVTGLPIGTHTVVIEWDIRQGGKNALDYITHYNSIDNGVGSHLATFNHLPEVIDATIGFSGLGSPNSFAIPAPTSVGSPTSGQPTSSFNTLPNDSLRKMEIWNGTITSSKYGTQGDLTAAAASQQDTIVFTNTNSTVVIAWGGHVAAEADWGIGNSASSISGSPYHTRLISFDGSGGNQDRSLSADAVLDPPACSLTGPSPVQCSSTNNYTSSGVPSGYTAAWTFTNNTSGASFVGTPTNTSATVNAGSAACNGKGYTLVYTISKNGSQVGSPCTVAVLVTDNSAPTIGSQGSNATIECTATPTFTQPTASDACGGATVHLLSDVTAAGSCANNFTRTRTWDATDACGNHSATVTQTITVRDTQGPNIGQAGANATIECTATPTFTQPTASDACGGATVNLLSDVTAAGSCANNFTRTRTWDATDACGNHSATVTQTVTVRDTQGPSIGQAGANATIECTATATFTQPTASDACGGATVNLLSDVTAAGSCANNFTRTRTWDATDACGNHSATVTQTVTVRDTQGPSIGQAGANATIECAGTPTFTQPTASDACGGATVNLLSDLTAAGSCANNFTRTRKWDATDACGNHSATVSQMVTVRDTQAPTIGAAGANATIECTATPIFTQPTASDACGGATVNLISDVTQAGSCAHNYTMTRTWDASDACGNHSATRSQTVTVVDKTAPVFTSCAADVVIECSASSDPANTGFATATDNCGTPTVTFDDAPSTIGCQTLIIRTWTADDGCGNTSTCVQHIIKRDRTAPSITCTSGGNATIHDNCTADANITKFYIDANGSRTWTAIDESGNVATASCPLTIAGRSVLPQETNTNLNTISVRGSTIENISNLLVRAYPNPFSDRVKFVIVSPQAGSGSLEVFDMVGKRVKTVYQGFISAGTQTFEMSLPNQQIANLIYVLRLGDKKVSGKILQINQ